MTVPPLWLNTRAWFLYILFLHMQLITGHGPDGCVRKLFRFGHESFPIGTWVRRSADGDDVLEGWGEPLRLKPIFQERVTYPQGRPWGWHLLLVGSWVFCLLLSTILAVPFCHHKKSHQPPCLPHHGGLFPLKLWSQINLRPLHARKCFCEVFGPSSEESNLHKRRVK